MKRKVIAVPTRGISKIVQKELFNLGYRWNPNKREYFDYVVKEHETRGYIILNGDGSLSNAPKQYITKNKKEYTELTMYALFNTEKAVAIVTSDL